jgi:hypothetical protein
MDRDWEGNPLETKVISSEPANKTTKNKKKVVTDKNGWQTITDTTTKKNK